MATLKQKIKQGKGRQVARRPLLKPDPQEPKSGCLWCPLFPFAHDFPDHEDQFQRAAQKIIDKEKEGHKVKSRFIAEPYREVDLLCVGEAPGAREDRKGEAFVGESGKLLRESLEEFSGIPAGRIAFSNVVRCRPPRNKDPSKTIVKCCGYELIREIRARAPKLVMALGNISMDFLANQTGITALHGHILKCTRPEFPDLDVLACLHPAYILRFDHMLDVFADAMDKAGKYVRGDYTPLPGLGEYFVIDDADDAVALLEAFREDKTLVTFDTETGALSPFANHYPQMLCFSFSNEAGVGYTIPFDHEDSPWAASGPPERRKDRAKVKAALRKFFADASVPKGAQNEKFDRQHIRHALGVEPTNVVRDTMLTHLTIDERRGTHGLKTLSYVYTGAGGYEKPLDDYCARHKEANVKKGGSYAKVPGKILFPYAGMDADMTWRVDEGLQDEPEYHDNPRLQNLANTFLPALSEALADIEYTGAQVNTDVVDELHEKYTCEMDEHSAAIKQLPITRQFVLDQIKSGKKPDGFEFNPGSTQQLRPVLFDYYGLRPTELTDDGFKRAVERHKKANQETKDKKGRPKKVSFGTIIDRAVQRKDWDLFSTKADVLHEYDRRGNDLAPLILAYRAADTLRGTFIAPLRDLLDAEGRVHGSFLIPGTVTGRLSSQDPNLQNIPNKDEGHVKRVYISRFGDEGLILQADYSQIELRYAACLFNDPVMLKAYRDGEDLHALTAHDIFITSGHTERQWRVLNDHERKEWRVRAKRTNFGILYGIGAVGLQMTMRKEGVFLTLDECRALVEAYFKARPVLKRGITQLERKAKRQGYLESFTGRRRRLPEVRSEDEELVARALRQSINFPIQSGAADMTLMSLVLIWREMCRRGLRSKIILTVHDSIIFDCHVDEVLEVAALAKEIMESLPELSDQVLPGVDWSWLKVPIVADCEVGVSWGQMVGFDPFAVAEGGEQGVDNLWARIAEKAA